MDVLNTLGALAEVILAIELVVLVFIIAAICGGVWFGVRFGEKKVGVGFNKVNQYIEQGRGYERRGLRMAVKPLIILHTIAETAAVTVRTLAESAQTRD